MWHGILIPVFHCRLSYSVHTPPCATACINICVHFKDPIVPINVWWIMETLKHPAWTLGWVARLSQLAFLRESNLNFPWGKSQCDNTIVNKKNEKIKKWRQRFQTSGLKTGVVSHQRFYRTDRQIKSAGHASGAGQVPSRCVTHERTEDVWHCSLHLAWCPVDGEGSTHSLWDPVLRGEFCTFTYRTLSLKYSRY